MRAYKVVDAFSAVPFKGNPVAVVLDAEGLSTGDMQAIAAWTNLSETTFVLPATDAAADYRLRIFTPRSELPFAGHPTIGSAHAVLEAGRATPREGALVQQCGKGNVRIAVMREGSSRRLHLELPHAKVRMLDIAEIDELEAILGVAVVRDPMPAIVDVGPVWLVAQVASAAVLLGIEPDFGRSAQFERRQGLTGMSIFGAHSDGDTAIEVRSFAPSSGVDEDPVCGSGNGSVAVFRYRNGMLAAEGETYIAAQGRKVGRDGRVFVTVGQDGQVMIGGACVSCIDGIIC